MWEFLQKKKPLRASKGQFSSERLSEVFPPLVLHLRSSSRKSGSEKGVFWKRGLFRKVHFLENLEILEILETPRLWKQRRIRPLSRDSRECRDFRDSSDSSSEKTPFVMTPFSGPELGFSGPATGVIWAWACRLLVSKRPQTESKRSQNRLFFYYSTLFDSVLEILGKLFYLQLELVLLTVKILCSQSLKALVRPT